MITRAVQKKTKNTTLSSKRQSTPKTTAILYGISTCQAGSYFVLGAAAQIEQGGRKIFYSSTEITSERLIYATINLYITCVNFVQHLDSQYRTYQTKMDLPMPIPVN